MTKIKVGDQVKIITGREKGKIAKIKTILRKNNKVIVENSNVKIKHVKPKRTNEAGKIIQFEAPIDISNIMVCNDEGTVSRIGYTIEQNKKYRKAKKESVNIATK